MKKSIKLYSFIILLVFFLLSVSFSSSADLKVTEEHPFYINGQYIPARSLNVGDTFQTLDNKTAKITNIKIIKPKNPFFVYNLEVPFFNNFVVGLENLIVHNSNLDSDGFVTDFQNGRVNPSNIRDVAPSTSGLSDDLLKRFDSSDLSLNEVGKLTDAQRLAYAEKKLGRTLNSDERKAVLAAHYSEPKTGRIFAKSNVLKEGGITSRSDWDTLMDNGITGKPSYTSLSDNYVDVISNEFRTLESVANSGIKKATSGQFKDVIVVDPNKANLDRFPEIKKLVEENGITDPFVVKRVNGRAKTLDGNLNTKDFYREIENSQTLSMLSEDSFTPRIYAAGSGKLEDGLLKNGIIIEEYVGDNSFSVKTVIDNALQKGNERAKDFALIYNGEISRSISNLDETLGDAGFLWRDASPQNLAVTFKSEGRSLNIEEILTDTSIDIGSIDVCLKIIDADRMEILEPGLGGLTNTNVHDVLVDHTRFPN